MNWLILYRKDSLQIDHFQSNSYQMPKIDRFTIYDPSIYNYVELVNPSFTIDRDHKVILAAGRVVDTEFSLNPVQPQPPEPVRNLTAEIDNLKIRVEKLEKK